jgi:hypothetical protein
MCLGMTSTSIRLHRAGLLLSGTNLQHDPSPDVPLLKTCVGLGGLRQGILRGNGDPERASVTARSRRANWRGPNSMVSRTKRTHGGTRNRSRPPQDATRDGSTRQQSSSGTNSHRHAKTKTARIRISQSPQTVRIQIQDNGGGIPGFTTLEKSNFKLGESGLGGTTVTAVLPTCTHNERGAAMSSTCSGRCSLCCCRPGKTLVRR